MVGPMRSKDVQRKRMRIERMEEAKSIA